MGATKAVQAEQALDQKLAELREAIRSANELKKDLANQMRELKEAMARAQAELQAAFEDQVRGQIASLGEVTKQAMDESAARVYREFDKLAGILLGLTEDDGPSLEELVVTMNAARVRRGQPPIGPRLEVAGTRAPLLDLMSRRGESSGGRFDE